MKPEPSAAHPVGHEHRHGGHEVPLGEDGGEEEAHEHRLQEAGVALSHGHLRPHEERVHLRLCPRREIKNKTCSVTSGPGRVRVLDRTTAILSVERWGLRLLSPPSIALPSLGSSVMHVVHAYLRVSRSLARFGAKTRNQPYQQAENKKTPVTTSPSIPTTDGSGARTHARTHTAVVDARTILLRKTQYKKTRKNKICGIIRQRASLAATRGTAEWATSARRDDTP